MSSVGPGVPVFNASTTEHTEDTETGGKRPAFPAASPAAPGGSDLLFSRIAARAYFGHGHFAASAPARSMPIFPKMRALPKFPSLTIFKVCSAAARPPRPRAHGCYSPWPSKNATGLSSDEFG